MKLNFISAFVCLALTACSTTSVSNLDFSSEVIGLKKYELEGLNWSNKSDFKIGEYSGRLIREKYEKSNSYNIVGINIDKNYKFGGVNVNLIGGEFKNEIKSECEVSEKNSAFVGFEKSKQPFYFSCKFYNNEKLLDATLLLYSANESANSLKLSRQGFIKIGETVYSLESINSINGSFDSISPLAYNIKSAQGTQMFVDKRGNKNLYLKDGNSINDKAILLLSAISLSTFWDTSE